MKLDEALSLIQKTGLMVMRTADVMGLLGISKDHASHILSRLAKSGHFTRLKRGVWLLSETADPFLLIEHLTAPFPAYISLQSALYHHGMISQIPAINYCVSLARSRVYKTSTGEFSIHHISEDFFCAYEEMTQENIKMATPEKAIIDMLYLSSAKTRLFSAFPELDIPLSFSIKRAEQIIRRIPYKQRRTMVTTRFNELIKHF